MLRTLKRWFSTDETKQLAEEVDKLIDRHQDYGHKLEGLSLRIERHLNKLRMHDARAAPRGDVLSTEEREILDDIRARERDEGRPENFQAYPGRDPFN